MVKCKNCKCQFETGDRKKKVCDVCIGFFYSYIKKPKMSDEEYQKILLMANVENIENES